MRYESLTVKGLDVGLEAEVAKKRPAIAGRIRRLLTQFGGWRETDTVQGGAFKSSPPAPAEERLLFPGADQEVLPEIEACNSVL
jgi:hypothetical protein